MTPKQREETIANIIRTLCASNPYYFSGSVWQCGWCSAWAGGPHNRMMAVTKDDLKAIEHYDGCAWNDAQKL